ncbi:MAG: zinc-dependent alcohol dehydrogenase family protein, partial [Sphingomicrobium sp.]
MLVKVAACSLNFRDLAIALGTYRMPTKPDLVPLSDGAGEVVEVGPGVTRVKAGDRVAGCFFQRWFGGPPAADTHVSALGGGLDGMLAQYVVLEQDGVVALPAHLTFEEAATLPCAAVTAWNALAREARVKAGDVVVLLGTGGVSLFALQFAKLHGARCIITSSSDDKLALARQLGADDLINYKRRPDWDKAVLELTDGRGADVVVEVVGIAAATLEGLDMVRFNGTFVDIGNIVPATITLPATKVITQQIKWKGLMHYNPWIMPSALEFLVRTRDKYPLSKVVSHSFPLADVNKAFAFAEWQGKNAGTA